MNRQNRSNTRSFFTFDACIFHFFFHYSISNVLITDTTRSFYSDNFKTQRSGNHLNIPLEDSRLPGCLPT